MKKTIKIYTLLKPSALALILCALFIAPAMSAERGVLSNKASTCAMVPCPLFQENDMTNAPATVIKPQHKPQRTAGTSSMSPALALAMALGVRTIQGPVEHQRPVMVRRGVPNTVARQVSLLPGDGARKKASVNAAALRLALED